MPYRDEIEVYGDEKDLAQFIAEELFDSNQSAISALAAMIRPILQRWKSQQEGQTQPATKERS